MHGSCIGKQRKITEDSTGLSDVLSQSCGSVTGACGAEERKRETSIESKA